MTDENKKVEDTEEVKETQAVEKTTQNDTPKEEVKEEKVSENNKEEKAESKKDGEKSDRKSFSRDGKKPFKKNFKKRPFKREKPEFDQKILSLRRVTRVMAGGRRFSFSVAMVIGDKKNRVGLGVAKANDVVSAIEKANRYAKKNMIKVKLTDNGSVPFDLQAKFKASEIVVRPITGKGLAAGGAVRSILEFAGVKEAGAKILTRSKNHINNAKATLIALEEISERYVYEEPKRKIMDRRRGGFKKGGKFTPRNNNTKKPFQKTDSQKPATPKVEKKD